MRPPVLLLGAVLAAASSAHTAVSDAVGLPDKLRTGRSLYQSGAGLDPVEVHRPGGGPLPPARFTCMGCHGAEGEGRLEGGLRTPPIARAALGPDAPARIADAMHGGAVMPAYALSPRDGDALAAYLAVVGAEAGRDPGLLADAIRLAVLLPDRTEGAVMLGAAAIGAAAALNARGGIFGRCLVAVLLSSSAQEIAGQDEVFALIMTGPLEAGALASIARTRMPVLSSLPAATPAGGFVYPLALDATPADAIGILAEVLRRSGRAVSRERVRAELDRMRSSDGLLLPASPGARRRAAAARVSLAGSGVDEAAP